MTQNTKVPVNNSDSYFTLDNTEIKGEGAQATTFYHFTATPITASPWGEGFQHGSPPAALVAYLLEAGAHNAGLDLEEGRFSRMTVDLLGAVPLGKLVGQVSILRPGKRISLLECVVTDESGREFIRGRGWWLKGTDTSAIERVVADDIPGPEQGTPATDWQEHWASGYIDSIEVIRVPLPEREHDNAQANPHCYWTRSTHPAVAGQEESAWTRLMKTADIANGLNSHLLDTAEWTYMNVDMSVYLHRMPVGEWTGIVAEHNYGPDGIGTTIARIYDTSGPIGTISQAIMLAPAN
ncbi:thioesterase family protein [Corynebacterium urogenitale]